MNATDSVGRFSAVHASIPQHERLKTWQRPPNEALPQRNWLKSESAYQNIAVRPEVSKGEHLVFDGLDIAKNVEALGVTRRRIGRGGRRLALAIWLNICLTDRLARI